MTADENLSKIKSGVRSNFRSLISSNAFRAWLLSDEKHKDGLVVVNNSFVFREGVKTNKNSNFLAVSLNGAGNVGDEIYVVRNFAMNSDFKFVSGKAKNKPHQEEFENILTSEIDNIGDLVFILIGKVDDSILLTEEIDQDGFEKVIWNPEQEELVKFEDNSISISDTFDEQAIWDKICDLYRENAERAPDDLREDVGKVLDKLQDRAKAALVIPKATDEFGLGVTDAVNQILIEERDRYQQALSKCNGNPIEDQAAFNEILRISYNFASDATTFLRLVVSVCDLKPIILWGTISEHFDLSTAFRQLPWERSRKKASLKSYIDVVGDARNSAFHNLFPFRKTLEISLPESSVKGAMLSIFSEYTKKKNNQLVYRDKELVDVLTEFTRARQRQIPSSFWSSNLKVMNATISLFNATSAHLKRLRTVSV